MEGDPLDNVDSFRFMKREWLSLYPNLSSSSEGRELSLTKVNSLYRELCLHYAATDWEHKNLEFVTSSKRPPQIHSIHKSKVLAYSR
jgi:hypothetical protein